VITIPKTPSYIAPVIIIPGGLSLSQLSIKPVVR